MYRTTRDDLISRRAIVDKLISRNYEFINRFNFNKATVESLIDDLINDFELSHYHIDFEAPKPRNKYHQNLDITLTVKEIEVYSKQIYILTTVVYDDHRRVLDRSAAAIVISYDSDGKISIDKDYNSREPRTIEYAILDNLNDLTKKIYEEMNNDALYNIPYNVKNPFNIVTYAFNRVRDEVQKKHFSSKELVVFKYNNYGIEYEVTLFEHIDGTVKIMSSQLSINVALENLEEKKYTAQA